MTALAQWAHAYPFSFAIDPDRSVDSYFPLASASTASSKELEHADRAPRTAQAERELDQAQRVEHAASAAKQAVSTTQRAADGRMASAWTDDEEGTTQDPRKRRRTSTAQGATAAVPPAPPRPPISTAQSPVPTAVSAPTPPTASAAVRRPGPVLSGDLKAPAAGPTATKAPAVPVARVIAPSPPPAVPAAVASGDRDYSLPDTFSHSALHPPLSGLRFDYYKPYLVNQPISPAWSSLYCETTKPDRLLAVDDPPPIVREIRSYEPNKELFRRKAPLHRSTAGNFVSSDVQAKLLAMRDVMRWIWDDDTLDVEEVARMILTAPLARYTIVRRICEEDLTRYLSHASALTARERDARTLLRWLAEAGAPVERRYRFFVDREGRARRGSRGEAGWEWWFAGGEEARRSMRELDEWEEETRKREGWP
ncbi:hypothetical protein JCM10449v2_005733 [Rhodotorula kratochvilovae]